MNPWSSLAVLLGLAAAAGKLPSTLTPLLPLVPSADPVRRIELSSGISEGEVDPETREILLQTKPRVEALINPIMGRILDASRATDLPRLRASAADTSLRGGRAVARAAAWIVLALSGGGILLLPTGLKGLSRGCGSWGFAFCRAWMALFSLTGAVLFCGAGINAWKTAAPSLWAVPVGGMLVNAAVLRCVDLNHPVWNRLLAGFLWPLAAAAFMFFWGRAVGRPLV